MDHPQHHRTGWYCAVRSMLRADYKTSSQLLDETAQLEGVAKLTDDGRPRSREEEAHTTT
eukprot:366399-Chlamydomonas_euryale.AAC.38